MLARVLDDTDDATDRFDPLDVAVYRGLREMERDREFNDRPLGAAGEEAQPQDFLTRAAHIKVMHPGHCAVGVARFEP